MSTPISSRAFVSFGVCLLTALCTLIAGTVAAGAEDALSAESFSAADLNHEESLTALFQGDFSRVDFNREDMMFSVVFQQYLDHYAQTCKAHFPANKVEMTTQECATERVTRNGYGVETSRVCVTYVDVGRGLYAKPDMVAAKQEIDRLMAADQVRQSWRLITMSQKDPFAGPMSLARSAQAAANDMKALVKKNACADPGLMRFEQNLRRFALNQQPMRLPGDSAAATEVALNENDFSELVGDLVSDHARSWVFNRFIRDSVTDVYVASRDSAGRPARVSASYSYEGFNGHSQGSLTLDFNEGSPSCMYFFDSPDVCRSPNRRIVEKYRSSPRHASDADDANRKTPAAVASVPTPAPKAQVAEPVTSASTNRSESRGASGERSTSNTTARRSSSRTALVEPPTPNPVEPAPAAPPPRLEVASGPKRQLTAVSYIQGIKDACLEVLTDSDPQEPELSYCFCLSAAAGSAPISDGDAQWFFENFSDEAQGEIEQRYPKLKGWFANCQAQREAG